MFRSGKPLATSLVALFLSGCAGDATAPVAPPDPPNRPPVVTGAIPDQRLAGPGATTTLDVAAHFSDPDGDALSYEAASSDTSVVAASAAGGAVTLTGGSVGGTGRVTVIARDPNGAEAYATFGTTVNRLPVLVGQIPIQALVTESPPVELDVSGFFSDPDGDALAFAAASSDASVVAVFVDGTVTVLSAQAIGEAEVTVTARDPEDAEAQATFVVAVTENPDRAALVALYHATDGPSWRQSDNWLTDAPIREWHGVSTAEGRVVQLRLPGNDLNGAIPPELGNLVDLQELRLFNNGLTGSIPPELGNLVSLQELSLRNNDLTGPIPPELGNLVSLQALRLYNNGLTGSIPPELGSLSSLKSLSLSENELTGSIPPELGNLVSLQGLRLDDNGLTGPIPPELGNLANLEALLLDHNGLTGPIPPELGNPVSRLFTLRLRYNGLTGPIPPELGNLANLELLLLDHNRLTGPIPPELGKLVGLDALWLHDNGLTGPIPPELGNLANLTRVRLGNNGLTGPIPPELGNLANLGLLLLDHNRLTGPIPPELGNLASLETLWLHYNGLTGPIPPELGKLASLETLWLRHNGLTGPIPPELGNLASLVTLEIGGNPGLCAPDDPRLRTWLAEVGANVFACLNPAVRLLPSALMRADGNGLSLALPDDFPASAAVNVSDPAVVAASVADGWLELAPRSPGSADVEVVPAGGGPPSVAGVVVRAGVGTFGIDIVVNQPAPIGYAEAMTAAADWWSSALDGTEWTDRHVWDFCFDGVAATADELVIFADNVADPGDWAAARARLCRPHALAAGSGVVVLNHGSPHSARLMRHEIGHVLGLVDVFRDGPGTGLTTGDRAYWIGPRAVEAYRAGGGDPDLPGPPIEPDGGAHWYGGGVCDVMGFYSTHRDCSAPARLSLAALADMGYTVDMTTPWGRNAAAAMGERFRDVVIVNPGPGVPRR